MARVPRHRRPGGLLDCAEVTAGWWLAGELQASPGQAVLLKAGAVGGGVHLEGAWAAPHDLVAEPGPITVEAGDGDGAEPQVPTAPAASRQLPPGLGPGTSARGVPVR